MFYNPGTLYGGLKIEELREGRYTAHTRNKLIAEAFYLVGEIEKYGSGFKRIQEEIANYPTMDFKFEETSSGFMVTVDYQEQKINNNNDTVNSNYDTVNNNNDTVNSNYDTVNSDVIINIIKNNEGISAVQIAKMINKSHISAKRYVSILKQKGLIEHRGSDKTGGYFIITDKKEEE